MSGHHTCPVWIGYLPASPIRKLFQNPVKMLSPYLREGMTVLDIGSAMGFFSIPMAEMVGADGRVVCVDLQQKMLDVLMKRARRAGVADRIVLHRCSEDSLGLDAYTDAIDFALASAVVHEVAEPEAFFRDVAKALKPGGTLLIGEPVGHVDELSFGHTLKTAEVAGLTVRERSEHGHSREALFEKH